MPRGLGDDPLSKKRGRRSRNVSSEGVTYRSATHRAVGPSSPNTVNVPSSSHNDVFFRRRDAELSRHQTKEQPDIGNGPDVAVDADKVPEISEAFDIVRIAEVSHRGQTDRVKELKPVGASSAGHASPTPEVNEPVSAIEPFHAADTEVALNAESAAGGNDAPAGTANSVAPSIEGAVSTPLRETQTGLGDQEKPEPEKKGILNRLFRRFGR